MATEHFSVATPRVAAGVVFTDGGSGVLMVRPTYKDFWDLPGGYVEPGESPRDAATREVKEELGLDVSVGAMLAVDWAPSEPEGDKVLFLFAGPTLTKDVSLRFEDGEIGDARYVPVDQLEQFTIPRLARRIRSAVGAVGGEYLEHGQPVTMASSA